MRFLPIVDRELRMASRRKATFRLRSWTAIIAILLCFIAMGILFVTYRRRSIGQPLFSSLTGYAFGLCSLAGIFLTADCLSEEKRDGTLGLLFLTDLNGYDVVAGKLMATLLSSLYGLLTLLPVIAVSLLLGGVTGGEFWRTAFALVNTLFVSLTAGIWISSLSRDGQQAMGRTFALMLILVVGLPVLESSLSSFGRLANASFLTWISPLAAFSKAGDSFYISHSAAYWGSLGISHLFAWLLLLFTGHILPSQWQEKGARLNAPAWSLRFTSATRGNAASREKARKELLPLNPVTWLVGRERGFVRAAWLIVIAWSLVVLLWIAFNRDEFSGYTLVAYFSRPFGFFLKFLFASQVCRFFVEARRTGALEMLLCTPLTNRDIVRGQALATRRSFLWPILVFVIMLFVPFVHHIILAVSSLDLGTLLKGGFGLGLSAITAVRTVADFFALFWFGLWLALTMKKPSYAPAMNILLVLILPSVMCWLDIFADLFFILLGVTKLQHDLRWTIANQFQFSTTSTSPLGTAASAIPPIIGTGQS